MYSTTNLADSLSIRGIRARSYGGAGNVRGQTQRARRHGAPIVLTVRGNSVHIIVRSPSVEETETVVDFDHAPGAIVELRNELAGRMDGQCRQRRTNMLRRNERTGGKGYMCVVSLCDAAECISVTLDSTEFDVLGRPWKPLSSSDGGERTGCHHCGTATSLEVLLGQKIVGEK